MLRMRIISGGTCGWFRLDSSAIALWMRFGAPEPEYISTAKPANFMMLMLLFITKLGTYLIIAKIILVQRQRNELSIVNRQYELHERAYRIYREHSDAERRLRHDFRHEHLRCCRCWLRRTRLANCVITSPRWYEPFLQVRGTVLPVIRNWMHCCSITRMRRNALGSVHVTNRDSGRSLCQVGRSDGCSWQPAEERGSGAAGCCAGERYADLRIGKVPGVCMIQVRNSYDGLIDERNGRFLSTKHNGMGMGLESVRLTAQRLHGECSVKHDGHVFTVRVSLPM